MDFGMPMMNANELIDLISNDDIMFQYQGVMQLRDMLSMSNEQSLGSFPLDRACKRLIDLLGQPVVSEFSHEIKYFAMACLHSLMDIYPSHIPNLIGQKLLENLSEAMEAAAAFGLEEMNQVCIKAIEQISQENPRAILNHSKALTLCINIIDFLDVGFQLRVLKILLNVSQHCSSEEQFNTALVPTLPILCQMLQVNCEDDVAKAERVSVILKRMTDSFTRFQSPIEKFDRIGAMFESVSSIGLIEIMVKALQDFSIYEHLKTSKPVLSEDQVMNQNINTQTAQKRTYNQATISNFLKIMIFASKYTQQIVMQLISGGIFEILESLIPDENEESAVYTQDVMGLLESLFPATESKDGSIQLTGPLLMLGNEQLLTNDAVNADPRMEKFKEAVKLLENEKRTFFLGFEESQKKFFMSKLLPKIFSVYKSNMQINVRTRCLNLIDKILNVVPSDLIQSQVDSVQFAQFLQVIFLSGNGLQVLLSLKMIGRVQETNQLKFAVQFIRQGISHFVTQLQDPQNVKHFDLQDLGKQSDPFSNQLLPKQFQNEKENLLQRIKEIQHILQISGDELTAEQKQDLDQILTERMNALINLKTKERMIAEVQSLKRTELMKDQPIETKEEAKEQGLKLSEQVTKEAQSLVKLYFENGEFISKVKQQFPEEIQVLQLQKKLAQMLLEESIQQVFDLDKTQKLMQDVAQIITSPLGITNFEFTESGLLKALQQFLTISPSQSLNEIQNTEEEAKTSKQPKTYSSNKISKKDAKCLILRLKVFAHVMCHEVKQDQARLPFLALIQQCHAVLSVNEPILFSKDNKESQQSTVEALKQLNKHVVINLVYDPDRKHINKEYKQSIKKSSISFESDKKDPLSLALANNDEMVDEEEDSSKMEADLLKNVPNIDRKIKSVALPFGHLSAADTKEEKSQIFKRRHKLFTELGQVPLNIQQRDNVWLLEDFLLKRIKTIDDVKKLVLHTRPAYSSGLFKNTLTNQSAKSTFEERLEDMENYQLQELHTRCLERIEYIIQNAQDSEEFQLMLPDNLKELSEQIVEFVKKFKFQQKDLELLFKHLTRDTEEMIKEHELGQGSDDSQEIMDRDANEIAYYIQIKVLDFIKMIEKLRDLVVEKLEGDENMEESKDQPKQSKPINNSAMDQKLTTKIEPTSMPYVKGDDGCSVKSMSEVSQESPQNKQVDILQVQVQDSSEIKLRNLNKSQQSDIEMTDEQNISLEDKNQADEVMKEVLQDAKLEDLFHQMPQKLNKSNDDKTKQAQKLMQQQIQKFKQQHILQQIAPDKAITPVQEQSLDEDFMKIDIEELIQLNQGEDIEIEFYCNGKKLELNTSFYEIIKNTEDPSAPPTTKAKAPKNATDHIREVLSNLQNSGEGFSLPNYHTIYFIINQKKSSLVQERKDSLADLAFRIQRSKSQVQEDISCCAVNLVVQQLIELEFQVFTKQDKRDESDNNTNAEKSEREKNMRNLEHALKVLKVLHFIHKSPQLLTEQGINFLLVKSSTEQLKKIQFDDMELLNVSTQQIKSSAFRHSKLDDNMVKQIQNPYKLVQGGLSEILKNIFQSCSFLFDFETKLLYFKLVSFIGIDMNRSLYFLQNYLTQKGLLGKSGDEQPSGPMSFFMSQSQQREDKQQNKVRKQLFKIDRTKILEESLIISSQMQKRCLLEIQYHNEVGTGLGPTLEFFTLFADEIKKCEEGSMWIKTENDEFLFPKARAVTPGNLEKTRRICQLFQLAGTFIAKSIIDDRLIDLPLSSLMWDLILGKKMNLFDLRRLNVHYFNTFSTLQLLANRKREIDEMVGLEQEARKRLLGSIKTNNGATVEDFDLYFVCPTESQIELIKDGQDEKVTLDNVQDYIDLSLHYIFSETISMQLKAFKKGFNSVLPIESLRPFRTEEELETLICGSINAEEWTDFDHLMHVIVPDHGFNHDSRIFRDFIRYLVELKPSDRPQLMKFFTGSKRLQSGGFAALNPHLTVVLKKLEGIPDLHLPSVSTCAKYLKVPEYSSYEILKLKFDQAMWEGADNFTLS